MFRIAADSAVLVCCPENALTRVAMFRAIWVSTGRSASALSSHRGLQPVRLTHSTTATTPLLIEFICFSSSNKSGGPFGPARLKSLRLVTKNCELVLLHAQLSHP